MIFAHGFIILTYDLFEKIWCDRREVDYGAIYARFFELLISGKIEFF